MRRRIVDVTLDNLSDVPAEALNSVFWELAEEPPVDASFEKEEWFSGVLLEWGRCAKLLVVEDEPIGFAEYAPPAMYPRLSRFRCGAVSPDAIYLSYCYVVAHRRGAGLGTELVRAVARDLVGRGFHALEAVGDREWASGWVLPTAFLARNGFTVLRDDARYPLMRLDLETAVRPKEAEEAAAAPLPIPAPGVA
ncbi:MAG: GNAT family N-acetyltransferase [Actinomycetota bacterium]